MEYAVQHTDHADRRLAERLAALRGERGWSLAKLAAASGVSRATLSRIENAEVSPTANVLGRLCTAYGLTVSRLMHMVEDAATPLVPRGRQPVWTDPATGMTRRQVSPPAGALAGEVVEGTLPAGSEIAYDEPPRPGTEHYLVLCEGRLDIRLGAETYALAPGDCLRYRLFGPSVFATPADRGARYLIFVL